jgi:hypothetical protein
MLKGKQLSSRDNTGVDSSLKLSSFKSPDALFIEHEVHCPQQSRRLLAGTNEN